MTAAIYVPTNYNVDDASTYKNKIDSNFLVLTPGGGFLNRFRNASLNGASRGASGSVTTGTTLTTLDGWYVGATGATAAWAQAYGNLGNSYSNFLHVTGNTSMTDTFIRQRIESYDAALLASQEVTIQFLINNATGGTITPTLTVKHPTAQDNWGATVTDVNAVSLQSLVSTASGILSYSFASSVSSYLGLEITLDFGAALNSNAKSIYMGYPDIRVTPGVTTGLNANPPLAEIRNAASEALQNARYLPAFGALTGPIGSGAATSSSAAGFFIPFRAPTFIDVTGLTVATVGDFEIADYAGSDVAALTGLTFNNASLDGVVVKTTVSGTPLTSGKPYFLYAKTALAGNLIFTGAEL